jgi:mRNA interferase RelE/StbE
MSYQISFKPKSLKDLRVLPENDKRRIVTKIESLQDGLVGDVKKLSNFTPEYRLRVGDYRVLFEIEGECVVVYRVLHRKESYR